PAAGFLGPEAEPWRVTCHPSAPAFTIDALKPPADVSADRTNRRRSLLEALGRRPSANKAGADADRYDRLSREAFGLICGGRVRSAFDLRREPAPLRDRYGRHKFGQGCLLARRLVEAGVCLVQLNWHREANDETPMWDAHWRLSENLKDKLMPPMDQAYSALLEDLARRGLLSETLV